MFFMRYVNISEDLIRHNGRKTVAMTVDEFKEKFSGSLAEILRGTGYSQEEIDEEIKGLWDGEYCDLADIIDKDAQIVDDLSDIKFVCENFAFEVYRHENYPDLIRLQTLENGFSFIGFYGQGESEYGVFCILYHDGTQIRAYQPLCGNTYNGKTNEAFGHRDNEDDDFINSDTQFLREQWNDPNIVCDCTVDIDRNWDLIKKDIMSYIEIVK